MSCCGQKRQQWQQQQAIQATPVVAEPVLEDPVAILYNGNSSYLIKGAVTGLVYLFGGNTESLMIDSRDVPLLLKDAAKFSLV